MMEGVKEAIQHNNLMTNTERNEYNNGSPDVSPRLHDMMSPPREPKAATAIKGSPCTSVPTSPRTA